MIIKKKAERKKHSAPRKYDDGYIVNPTSHKYPKESEATKHMIQRGV